MDTSRRSSLGGAIVLILLGVWFLAVQLVPGLREWVGEAGWPLIIIGAGVLLLAIGLAVGAPPMAVPACIVAGVGGLLYYQNLTGDWGSWAFAWALIPGFVGVGIILSGLLGWRPKEMVSGAWMVLISLGLFAGLAAAFGRASVLGPYWPVIFIVLGLLLLVRPLLRTR